MILTFSSYFKFREGMSEGGFDDYHSIRIHRFEKFFMRDFGCIYTLFFADFMLRFKLFANQMKSFIDLEMIDMYFICGEIQVDCECKNFVVLMK